MHFESSGRLDLTPGRCETCQELYWHAWAQGADSWYVWRALKWGRDITQLLKKGPRWALL